jgi:hypothetical protein
MKKCIFSSGFLLLAFGVFSQTTSWTGAADSCWHNPTNWTAGLPNDTMDVVIGDANYYGSNLPAVLSSASCKNLTLNSGFKLKVYTGDDIVVKGNLTNNGLIIGDSTSFVFEGSNVSLCGTGTAVYKTMTVLPGVNFTLNKNISLSGYLVVDGTLSATGKTISFVGPSPSVISGSGSIVLGDLVQNKDNSYTRLESPVTINGNLTLTNGVIYTSPSSMLTISNNATSGSGNKLSYVDGPMKKVGDEAFVFPLGNNGVWARCGISAPTLASDEFVAQYFSNPYSNTDSILASSPVMVNVSKVEYWTCERSGGSSNVSVTLYWEDNVRSDFSDYTSLVVASWDGSRWDNAGTSAIVPLSQGSITSEVQSSFNQFTFGSVSNTNPMPIGLTNFTAVLSVQQIVDLNWQTATETNNRDFTVQKSADGMNYETVAVVEGAGTSLVTHSYHVSDAEPFDGVTYYRIRQTDNDGKSTYSSVRVIQFENNRSDVQLYPNPSNGESITVGLPGSGKIQRVAIYNSMGQQVYQSELAGPDNASMLVETNQLPRGVYTVVAVGDERSYKKKLVIEVR